MPVPAIVPAIITSIISAVADAPSTQQQVPVTSAIERAFPAESLRGELVPPIGLQEVEISGNKIPAAPGLQIRNQENLIVMPSALQQPAPVRYQLDLMGNVWRIWVLSAAEAAASNSK